MEENPNDAHNRRTLRPCDTPQNREDTAALKLLAAVDRQPHVEIVRIVFYTGCKGAEGIAYLELRSTDLPEGVSAANFYARIELPLATIFETPVEKLTALLKRRRISLTAITQSAGTPPRTTLIANYVMQTTADAPSVRRAHLPSYDALDFDSIEEPSRR